MKLTAFVLFTLVAYQSICAQEPRETARSQSETASEQMINRGERPGDKMRASGCGDGSLLSETGTSDDNDERSSSLRDGTSVAKANAQTSPPGRSGDSALRTGRRPLIGLAKAGASIVDNTQKRKHNMSETTGIRKDWKQELSTEQYRVLREKGTEPAFSGAYYTHDEKGNYYCAGCGNLLFTSGEKYHSGSGWPSFYAPADKQNVRIQKDTSHGMIRDEVLCAHCGGHLGHVFDDGPQPTGQRYCINSVSLDFRQTQDK